ncbi:hypothetical protein GGR88_000211 [Sphingomonas jejuensis]|uniref:YdhG-like domain-containing protein n=1 Tax=Sphingomonas jejuensis TaxID=904715 RepID=A0ABX0XIQ0_9SPHN|nr:DUF1801 domain-containing protein [Sphingomonas jejuensis]NJC32737.1 hypothetical protein [Sphingomonas jejuensis]
MAENKTKATDAPVGAFLNGVALEGRRNDAWRLAGMMAEETGEQPVMWGNSIVGFGDHHYRYASGREGSICRVGFSPRKSATVLYLSCDLDQLQSILDRLGPHERGVGCLYIKRLDAIDDDVLRELIRVAWVQR